MNIPQKPQIPSPAWVEFNGIQVTVPDNLTLNDTDEYVIMYDTTDEIFYLAVKS